MKRSVARCKRCGTEFPLVGEVSGCPNCGNGELDCFPDAAAARNAERDEWQAVIDDVNREVEEINKMFEEDGIDASLLDAAANEELLAREKRMDQEIRELVDMTDEEVGAINAKKDWSKEPHDPHCCCDKCAPTREALHQKVKDFRWTDMMKKLEDEETIVHKPKVVIPGICRTCRNWRKNSPQVGECWRDQWSKDKPVRYWFDNCASYNRNPFYEDEQKEIIEKRKAHDSILRAMERSRA